MYPGRISEETLVCGKQLMREMRQQIAVYTRTPQLSPIPGHGSEFSESSKAPIAQAHLLYMPPLMLQWQPTETQYFPTIYLGGNSKNNNLQLDFRP